LTFGEILAKGTRGAKPTRGALGATGTRAARLNEE